MTATALAAEIDLDRCISSTELQPAYQPIIDLASNEVVGFEALARWPNLPGALPDVVFATARRAGRTVELDWACRLAALNGALEQGLGRDQMLFVNIEPATLGTNVPPDAERVFAAARRELRVMLEITERSLARRPAELLELVSWARRNECGIALDDVGAEPESLALLPFLAPDVIKLDMALVRDRPDPERAAVMAAVMAHSERTGATVLAEGVETVAHLDQGLALGATLGQGWLFGRPGPLFQSHSPGSPIVLASPGAPVATTPFSLVKGHPQLRVGRKALLLDLSRHIENQGHHLRPAPVVLSSFQTAERFTPATATRYTALATRCALVGALGCGLGAGLAPGVHGSDLSPTDPLLREWTVTVIGSHYAGALIARDLGDDGPDHERRFEFVVSHDRELVLAAARSLMSRIVAN
jgi:EAL domain-containing protein (putative c-di-GMP-specific phosphodiesterase class I)